MSQLNEDSKVEALLANLLPEARRYLNNEWSVYDEATREDFLQDAEIKFYAFSRSHALPERVEQCRPLFRTILKRIISDYGKKKSTYELALEVNDANRSDSGNDASNASSFEMVELEEFLRVTLSEKEISAAYLRSDGYTLDEIATQLGVSRDRVRKLLNQSKSRIAMYFTETGETIDTSANNINSRINELRSRQLKQNHYANSAEDPLLDFIKNLRANSDPDLVSTQSSNSEANPSINETNSHIIERDIEEIQSLADLVIDEGTQWLYSFNLQFGQAPVELIRAGQKSKVLEVLQAVKFGMFS